MQFSIGLIKSDKQCVVRNFSQNEDENTVDTLDISRLSDQNTQAIIYDSELSSELVHDLTNELKFTPIRSSDNFSLSSDDFCNISFLEAKETFLSIQENWTLNNNIALLENLFKTVSHLKTLWPNTRSDFFEELWFILRSNLGTSELSILFNDLVPGQRSNEKDRLVSLQVTGKRLPSIISSEELTDKLMLHYKRDFGPVFSINEYNKDKGELVAVASVNNDPILIMAKIYQVNKLQLTIAKTLFDGLQDLYATH